ncbi:MAG: hypothetical protein ACFHXK_09260 [bacterium]
MDFYGLKSRSETRRDWNNRFGPRQPGEDQIVDYVGGAGDMYRNYRDMCDANTLVSDKYFHCKANCEATQRGKGGYQAACDVSDAREFVDGLLGQSSADEAADRSANSIGRGFANLGLDCPTVCALYRPNGLPPQY